MENYYKCRFCFKSFVNGRALGGHMRSHMPSLHKFSMQEEEGGSQLSDEAASDVSSYSSEGEEGKRNGLRDKHPMMADNESETESSRNVTSNTTRKRSKRTRKLNTFTKKKIKASQLGYKAEPECEPPHSSASDATSDEDLAFCLMMLSRDKWKKKKNTTSSNKEVVEEMGTEASEGHNKSSKKGRFTCETCGKVFKSYQALGGHRASHKKNRASNKTEQISETEYDNVVVVVAAEKRIHGCPICLRVFASGQALGGHKRSHGIGNLSENHHQVRVESVKQSMIDLNLPAPTDEEEVSVVFQ
ncbi:Zinc finger protein ZAT9 [Hirschfeldia incana]|nr:Zinc finger protein ZAT9 [Hirschfeldia incana]